MSHELSRLAAEEANDGVVQFFECRIPDYGGLQDSSAVNHECCGNACNIPVETRDLTIVCQQRICHGYPCQSFSLCGRVFVREAKYCEPLILMLLIEVVESWHFRQAGSAPGRPNIH